MGGLVWLVCILAQVVWSSLYGLVCKLGTAITNHVHDVTFTSAAVLHADTPHWAPVIPAIMLPHGPVVIRQLVSISQRATPTATLLLMPTTRSI